MTPELYERTANRPQSGGGSIPSACLFIGILWIGLLAYDYPFAVAVVVVSLVGGSLAIRFSGATTLVRVPRAVTAALPRLNEMWKAVTGSH